MRERKSGIELLRILAMVFIVAHHLSIHSLWGEISNPKIAYIIDVLGSFGKVGVGVFFIISGFFMAKSSDLSFRKTFPIIKQTWFYSLTIFILFLFFKRDFISFTFPFDRTLVSSLFPILTNGYWFVSSFVAIRLLFPYMRKWFDGMDDSSLLKCFAIVTLLLVLPSFISVPLGSYQQFIFNFPIAFYYCFLGYFLYRFYDRIPIKVVLVGFLVSVASFLFVPLIITTVNSGGYALSLSYFTSAESFLCIMLSSSIFILFSKINIQSIVINAVSSSVFGVYLIHDNILMRRLLWQSNIPIFSPLTSGSSVQFLGHYTLIVVVVFGFSILIDKIRVGLFKFIGSLSRRLLGHK